MQQRRLLVRLWQVAWQRVRRFVGVGGVVQDAAPQDKDVDVCEGSA